MNESTTGKPDAGTDDADGVSEALPVTAADSASGLVTQTGADSALDHEEVYIPGRRWLGASPGRPVLLGAFVLIALQTLIRGWSKANGWFVVDDLAFIGRSLTRPLWSSEYLLESWHGHLMPGAFVVVRLFTDHALFDYTPVAVVDGVLQLILSLLVLRLLSNLFGLRRAILIPLAIFLFSPMTLPAYLWWAAALNQLYGQLAMVGMFLFHLRYLRSGRLRWGMAGVVVLVLGLLFSEKVILMVPVLAAWTLLYFTPGRPFVRLRRITRTYWPLGLAYGIVSVGYTWIYLTIGRAPASTGSYSVRLVLDTIANSFMTALLPAVFGGPLTWFPVGNHGATADPGPMASAFYAVIALTIIWASVWRHIRAVFAWSIVLVYVVVNLAILSLTRATFVGPIIGAEYRYLTDSALIIIVFGSMAFLPLVGTFAKGPHQRLLARQPNRAMGELPQTGLSTYSGLGVGAAVVVVVTSSVISTVRFDSLWRDTTTEAYYARARAAIESTDHPVTIMDGMLVPLVPMASVSTLFPGFRPKPNFLTLGRSTDVLFALDDAGELRRVHVEGRQNKPGPEKGCGWRIDGSPNGHSWIPLDLPTLNYSWLVQVGYVASEQGQATITAGEAKTAVTFEPGAHDLFVLGTGEISGIEITAPTFGTVCTDAVRVGWAEQDPNTSPASVYGPAKAPRS